MEWPAKKKRSAPKYGYFHSGIGYRTLVSCYASLRISKFFCAFLCCVMVGNLAYFTLDLASVYDIHPMEFICMDIRIFGPN